jgi:hypothetical protein
MTKPRGVAWKLWSVIPVVIAGYLTYSLFTGGKSAFLIGRLTDGHHQLALACSSCHTPFGGPAALQKACLDCHADQLRDEDDSHRLSLFTDPRNAGELTLVDARSCLTCHTEHRPQGTQRGGVTVPVDFCFACHADVVRDRPSHASLAPTSCANAGCHNYHDNRALYEAQLAKHLHEPALLVTPRVPQRTATAAAPPAADRRALTRRDVDAPAGQAVDAAIAAAWSASAHAAAGVNCGSCHEAAAAVGAPAAWTDHPARAVCATCHAGEDKGFLAGRHGMRLAADLPAMTPAEAVLPMHDEAAHRALGCTSCHGAHDADTRRAAATACQSCHDDTHTRAFANSPHGRLWQAELDGTAPAGSGVSCATCHLPRETRRLHGADVVAVQHNQNLNLRPADKMLRGVCMDCHGLGFALDALADPELVRRNFAGHPADHVPSLDWAERRQSTLSNPAPSSVPQQEGLEK